ncbi:YvrJ protein family protein [Halobacillus aidingensis]|uniref:YvrJ protein family protein n=1 Tax=Halobacillus aidingensis TaxID=240303 RepID=A0A1H0V6C0_HALAD|nr:YvrJ protein family protein [Halobacillus aidingensis]
MGIDAWISILADVGFPVAVTFYLLHRVEGKLDQLIETLHQLPEKIVTTK